MPIGPERADSLRYFALGYTFSCRTDDHAASFFCPVTLSPQAEEARAVVTTMVFFTLLSEMALVFFYL